MFQPGAVLYVQSWGSRPENVEVPIIQNRAPATTDVSVVGKRWIDSTNNASYDLTSLSSSGNIVSATWVGVGGGSSQISTLTGNSGGALSPTAGNINILGAGALAFSGSGSTLTGSITPGTALIATLTGGTGGALSPTAGNFNLLGTANQITSTGSGSTITFSLPSAVTAPGSLTTVTSLTAGNGFTVTTGTTSITGTVNVNISGAGVTTIGTGGTGAVNIGNATGNTAVTGSLTASTTLTATLGAITASNGNLVLGTAGNKIISTSVATTTTAGANSFGTVTLSSGTATISTTAVTASSIIMLTRQSPGATGAAALGILSVGTISAGVSFIINALTTADATAVATTDVSSIGWMIIN